ncbi:MAG: D-alanine--D-alanine ligase family protein [Actinomycetota bacterium]
MASKPTIAVLYGGRSAEHEVSVVSARCVLEAIDRDKYTVVPIAIGKSGRWMLPTQSPAELTAPKGSLPSAGEDGTSVSMQPREDSGGAFSLSDVDVVFPVLHGPNGEDGTIQGLLETAGVPYVGAGVLASALGMDKEMQKRLFEARGLHVGPWLHLHRSEWIRNAQGCADLIVSEVGLPCFTKPARMGSSIGVSKCESVEALRQGIEAAFQHDSKVLIEKAIVGRELECAVLGNADPEASVVGEVLSAHEFYDYEAKYLEAARRTVIPASLPDGVSDRVRRYALEAFSAIECVGMARVDFFYETETRDVLINEINTIPGFTPISMYPQLWEASGVPYAKLIDRLIELALER